MFLINPFAFDSGNLFAVTPYTGNGSARSIVTGQNQSAGALDWITNVEGSGVTPVHNLYDTVRGINKGLVTEQTAAENSTSGNVTAFNNNGFSLGTSNNTNGNTTPYVAFSWLEQAGFMDVVLDTGTGVAKTVTHGLTATPQLMIRKRRDSTSPWIVYHSSLGNTQYAVLNTTAAAVTSSAYWNNTSPTSSVFTVGTSADVNTNGGNYVTYLFAQKSGKSNFGVTNATSPIDTGVTNMSFLLVKRTDASSDWYLFYKDGSTWYILYPNTTNARTTSGASWTGGVFNLSGILSTGGYIYYAAGN